MCIAIYSPKGIDLPCKEYLENSFLYNPDGAGFAFNTPQHHVQILKGYFSFDAFYKALMKADKKYNLKTCGVLIHCRISTHGGTNKECCHPFPLVADEGIMKKTDVKADYAVIHNGIIDLTSKETYTRDRMSDTMVFIEKYLSKIATNKRWFKNKTNFELIYDMIDSKMAVLNGYGDIHATQGFTKDPDGNFYSNTSYKEAKYVWRNHGVYNNWFEDEDDYWGVGNFKSYSDTKILPSDTDINEVEDETPILQKLEKGMYAECTHNGRKSRINYEDGLDMFINKSGSLWYSSEGMIDDVDKIVYDNSYMGEGAFFFSDTKSQCDFTPEYTVDIY